MDFEKAFDRVEHGFLFSVLKKFGFGENFIKWIAILYKDILTKVKCNVFLSQPFKVLRSIRQGCPLSAQLYSLVAEPLGHLINKEEGIKGIKMEEEGEFKKIFQYADDTTIVVENMESVKKVMEKIQYYCDGTGAKINEEKTVYMKFGGVVELAGVFKFMEVQEIKILGVVLAKDEKVAVDNMWEGIVGGMERRLIFWRSRFLSLRGKILIVNLLMLRHFNEVKEKDIWKIIKWQWLDVELECLDYFIRHNVVFTEMRLCAMQKETNAQCKVCKIADEGILHLFLYCGKLTPFFLKN